MKMEPVQERYLKLPGRRRGLLFGSSVWLGSDHLLLVKSSRFREEYKRFHFKDVQAIVIAEGTCYHLSSRSIALALVLLAGMGVAGATGAETVVWSIAGAGLLLVLLWAYLSYARSCRCRIYTAVSSEVLPSLYRASTAQRFLKAVEPHIHAAQGVIEGPWAEAAEERQIGPLPEGRVGLAQPAGVASPVPQPESLRPNRTRSTIFFALTLCLGGAAELLTLRLGGLAGRWVLLTFLLLQIVAAVTVLIRSFSAGLRAAMRNLAIVTLVCIGIWYYAVVMSVTIATAVQGVRQQQGDTSPFAAQAPPLTVFEHAYSRGSAGGMSLILGLICAVMLLRDEPPSQGVSIRV